MRPAPGPTVRLVTALSGVLCAAVWLQAAAAAPPAADEGWYTKAQALRGQASYDELCASCHGEDFVPDDFSPGLTGPAFDWTWGSRTVFDLFDAIRQDMPPDRPGTLDPATAIDITSYLLQANDYPPGETELGPEPGPLKALSLAR